MKNLLLSKAVLFKGIAEDDLQSMLDCLGAYSKKYKKGETIFHVGSIIDTIGIVLSGSVIIENDDIWGNKSILDHIGPGQIFAETYACIPGEPLLVSIIAAENCEIMFINISRALTTCYKACVDHNRIIRNLLTITAHKNLNLSRRILYTSSKTIRGRLLAYFSHRVMESGCLEFTVPFNRQQLADYLGVDRSAMSNELSKMRSEGIIEFDKNRFILKQSD